MARTTSAAAPSTGALRPREFLAALRAAAFVLEDHAAALDRLDAEPEWDLPGDGGPATGPGPAQAAPSGGPGTDLATTLSRACDDCGDAADFSSICARLADGARAAARGTAGRRLAGFLEGVGEVLRNADGLDGLRLALALEAGAERLAGADDGAHPGGLPAVVAASADAALSASDDGSSLADVLVSAADGGLAELEQGPVVDPRLAERGTVDAAAAGFLLVLDSLSAVVAGEPLPTPPDHEPADQAAGRTAPGGHRYRVTCRVTPAAADPEAAAELEVVLHELADRLEFHGAGTTWTVDLDTALPGAAVEAVVWAGAPTELHISVIVDDTSGAPAPATR